jgi:hypothetical protein
MKKLFLTCSIILMIALLISCLKTNSTTPISSVQVAIAGNWQVDSSNSYLSDSLFADSVYNNHLITIKNSGNKVTVQMSATDIMTYTISDSTLTPYVKGGIFSVIGCGLPNTGTKISLNKNQLQLISYNGFINTLYMHRRGS